GAVVWDWNLITDELDWSDEYYRAFGYSEKDTLPTIESWSDFIHEDDVKDTLEGLHEVINSGETNWAAEYRFKKKDGTYGFSLGWGTVIHDTNEKPVRMIGAMLDITERRRAEDARIQMEEAIQKTQKLESLGVLAGGIAHDFNNLLMAILGNADLAQMELSPVSPAYDRIEDMMSSARHAADLCRQMLAYSGKGKFVVDALSLTDLVDEMSQILNVSISKKAVLKYNFADNLPAVKADATQMRQIIMNLITNASEAIGDKSGVISISTGAMECDRSYLGETYLDNKLPEGIYSYFEVADTGCGMSKETKQKLFDPFYTTKFTGRGLGMSAVLGIVRGHKGAIKVYSELNKGTTFKVLFPAAEEPANNIKAAAEKEAGQWQGSGTILIVDDEETILAVGRRYLEKKGFSVLTALDGREGVEVFQEHAAEIVCVILDLTMPHMDGEETFREIRR
ncbi:MAG: PAS domain-containing protein, partial [Deltaproteobacteria bacterium]|nr:PAS domain-containing protein [Deltaproteobacteria bacterium]